MAAVVFDASAIIALLRNEPGAEAVAAHIGDGLISAVNLQEVVMSLLRRGAPLDAARTMIEALHLDVRPHSAEDAFSAAALHAATAAFGSGVGDRSCIALAIAENLPALTADKDWSRIAVPGLKVMLVR